MPFDILLGWREKTSNQHIILLFLPCGWTWPNIIPDGNRLWAQQN